MGVQRSAQYVRAAAPHRRDAVRGRRGGCRPRFARSRRSDHHVHRFSGSAAHDPQHVQDRGRAAPLRVPRFGTRARGFRAQHLRRSFGRDERSSDGLRDAVLQQRPGGHGPRARRAPFHAGEQGAFPALLRRFPYQPRSQQDRRDRIRRDEVPRQHGSDTRFQEPRAQSRAPRAEGYRSEPRHLFPGQRGRQQVL